MAAASFVEHRLHDYDRVHSDMKFVAKTHHVKGIVTAAQIDLQDIIPIGFDKDEYVWPEMTLLNEPGAAEKFGFKQMESWIQGSGFIVD